MNTDTTSTPDPDREAPHANGADHAIPLPPPLADAEAVMRGLVQTYPLFTLAGAVLGGYVVARVLRRVR